MGRLQSALRLLLMLVAALLLMAQMRPGLTESSVAQAVDFSPAVTTSIPEPTLVYFLPLVHGSCPPGCSATPPPSPTDTVSPSATPSPSPTPTPSIAPSPTSQPETRVLPVVADTFVVEGTSGQGDANFGEFPGMFVGYDEQGWRRERVLLRFDLSPLPRNAHVVHAALEVYIHNCFHCRPMDVDAVRVTGAWGEYDATWNNSVTLPGEPHGRGVMVAPLRWLSIDVTALVSQWQADSPNHGVMLVGREAPPYDWWSIEAREDGPATAPRIVVAYLGAP